jgi:Amt family ammonium transporter
MWLVHGKPDPSMMCNSMLAGPGGHHLALRLRVPGERLHHRAVAGVLVIWSVNFFDRLKIDDPVGAISGPRRQRSLGCAIGRHLRRRHLWPGLERRRSHRVPGRPGLGVAGMVAGDYKQIVAQAIEVVVGLGWNVIVGGIAFFIVGKLVGGNRVEPAVEIAGLDGPEMGVPG